MFSKLCTSGCSGAIWKTVTAVVGFIIFGKLHFNEVQLDDVYFMKKYYKYAQTDPSHTHLINNKAVLTKALVYQ